MPDNTAQTGGASTNQGVDAGSEKIEITQKELQSKIDSAVRAALETREKHLQKQYEEEVGKLTEEIERLKAEANKGSKTLEEQLKETESQKAKLASEVKSLKKSLGDLEGRFGSLLETELGALGDKGKAKFEQICPDGLSEADKLVFLAKVKPLLGEGEAQDKTEKENPAKGKPPITTHEAPSANDEVGFGKQMAEQKRAEESAASEEGYNPWGQ